MKKSKPKNKIRKAAAKWGKRKNSDKKEQIAKNGGTEEKKDREKKRIKENRIENVKK